MQWHQENLRIVIFHIRIAKASQNMLSICLKQELKSYDTDVISIHPGKVKTQSGSSDANSSACESARKIFKWIEGDNTIKLSKLFLINKGGNVYGKYVV